MIYRAIILFALFICTNLKAATRYSVVSGNWSNIACWSTTSNGVPGASVPGAGDDVIIERGIAMSCNGNITCNSVTLKGSVSVLYGNNTQLIINNNRTLTLTSGLIFNTSSTTGTAELVMNNNTVLNVGTNVDLSLATASLTSITLSGTTPTVNIAGNVISPNNVTFTAGTSTVNYNGTSNQNTGNWTYNNLTISGSASKLLQGATTVNGILTLTAGELDLNAYTLTVSSSAITTIVRTAGWIKSENENSLLKWNVSNVTGNHVYPFGYNSTYYIPVTISVTAGNHAYVSIYTFHTADNNLPRPTGVTNTNDASGFDNSINTVDRFWGITQTGSGVFDITFTYIDDGNINPTLSVDERPGVMTSGSYETALKAQLWSGSTWLSALAGQTNNTVTNTVTTTNVTLIGVFTLAKAAAPLPIELIEFKGYIINSNVLLDWRTATEINCERFDVQRSIDGVTFNTIGFLRGSGNSSTEKKYTYVDKQPLSSAYYRVKQIDYDGKYTYTPSIYLSPEINEIIITDNEIKIAINKTYYFYITNVLGENINSQRCTGEKIIDLNSFKEKGLIFIYIVSDDFSKVLKIYR